LLELTEDSVTLPPLAVRLPFCVCVVPTVMLPKVIAAGATARLPLLTAVPLPVRAIATEGLDALEATFRVALLVPALAGVNAIDKFALLPAAKL
jgi:hypothetical protein